MLWGEIGVVCVYNCALKRYDLEGGGLHLSKIGGGERNLEGRQT